MARQCCGLLGKQDNCQVAVSVTLGCQTGSLPVAWQLYLPESWANDKVRREKAGVPQDVVFATKPAIALARIEQLLAQGAPKHCVLADAGYGVDTAFRERLSELGLTYAVGVTGHVTVWPRGRVPLPPAAYKNIPRLQETKTLHDAKNLPYPHFTNRAKAQRTQRHVPSSITTLRLNIAAALLKALLRCPCCLRLNAGQVL